MSHRLHLLIPCVLAVFAAAIVADDEPPKPVTFTTPEDHQQMLQQLGIRKLRPGPSGNASATESRQL